MYSCHRQHLYKKGFYVLLFLLIFCCSCGKQDSSLKFPEIEWNMSAEEVMKIYGVAKEDTAFYEESNRSTVFSLKNQEIFGETAETIHFEFINLELDEEKEIQHFDKEKTDKDEVLCAVSIIYPQDADMEKIQRKMEMLYRKYELSKMKEFSFFNPLGEEKLSIFEYKESDTLKLWGSETIEKALEKKDKDLFRENWTYYMTKLDESQWEEFSENGHLVSVSLDKDSENPVISFDAYNLAVYEEIEESEE